MRGKLMLNSAKNQNLDVQSAGWCMTARDSRRWAIMWLQLEKQTYIHDVKPPETREGRK